MHCHTSNIVSESSSGQHKLVFFSAITKARTCKSFPCGKFWLIRDSRLLGTVANEVSSLETSFLEATDRSLAPWMAKTRPKWFEVCHG